VLVEGPLCELGADLAVQAHGGLCVQPWRDRFRASVAAELEVIADAHELPSAAFDQAVVHLQKSRAATFDDLAEAWRALRADGRLLLAGPNALGIVSAAKRLGAQLDQKGIVVTNRARARVVRFRRDDGPGPVFEPTPELRVALSPGDGSEDVLELATAPGVFSARRLDAGSQLLLEGLPGFTGRRAPSRIVDLGCGTGVLGLSAARLWPDSEILLLDADARAVRCAEANARRLGVIDRCRVAWWDAREPPIEGRFDLALVNPPFHHHGPEVDLGPALALFDSLPGWLGPRGRALLVANRTLPYERPLAAIGEVETLGSARGYKLLSLKIRPRSSGSRGRRSPGASSGGRSKPPIRSR